MRPNLRLSTSHLRIFTKLWWSLCLGLLRGMMQGKEWSCLSRRSSWSVYKWLKEMTPMHMYRGNKRLSGRSLASLISCPSPCPLSMLLHILIKEISRWTMLARRLLIESMKMSITECNPNVHSLSSFFCYGHSFAFWPLAWVVRTFVLLYF